MSVSTPNAGNAVREPRIRANNIKLLIAGSRCIYDIRQLYTALNMSGILPENVDEIVSGGATGVDTLAESVAKNLNIPTKIFNAEWTKYGKEAGFIRNEDMAQYADELLALWDGESRGTAHMVNTMKAIGKPVHLLVVGKDGEVAWVE